MEIKTSKAHGVPDSPAVEVPPDRPRPARKIGAQKSPRTKTLGARIFGVVRVLAGVSLIALLVMAAFAAYRYAHVTDLLRLRRISITGCRHADSAKVEALVRRNFQGNLLRLDLAQLRARLEREPWIRRAEIRRVLPETLIVQVEERVPSVVAEIGGELQLLDEEGVLLDRYGPGYDKIDVPVFSGLKGGTAEEYQVLQEQNSARVRTGVEVLKQLASGPPEMTSAISEIDLSDESNVKLVLVDDTASVYLGDRDFFKRFQMFLTNLAQYQGLKAEGKEVDVVDLRFDGQIWFYLRQTDAGQAVSKGNSAIRNAGTGPGQAMHRGKD